MDDLKNKRKVIKTQITMLKKETDGYATATPDIGTLQTHQQRINRLETELGDNWNAVAILCKDDKEYDTHTPYYEDVIGKVCDIKAKILNTMATLNTNTPIPNPTSQPQPAASTGMPDNELQLQESEVFYLPHHAVLKEASTSTKVRVVFDGSAKSTSGYSLNNCMMVGPVVQSDLFTILIRFRRWRIALTADIIKMYRQILISPSQTNLQRVLWRFNDSEPVGEYKSVTVTFGTASAPFLATQTLCQLANDEGSKFPMAAPVLLKDAYVDDIATGEVNVNRAVELYSQLDSITKCAGFELSKWVSNSGEKFTTHQFLKPSEEALQELKKVKIEVHHCHMTEDFFGRLVRLVQRREFHDEYQALQLGMPLPKKSKLITLHPFIDQHGCIRVGGRLQNSSNLPEERKHPLILPGHHRLTKLLIRHLHETYLHAGPSLLLHLLQNRYWVLRAKNNVKYYVRKCMVCTRQRAETAKQLMGNLPASRVTPSRAFLHSGVDYAGPLMLRPMKGRSNKLFKCYIALFVCFSTRAIHLEAVSDMSASSFLAALHRFVSRRGLPSEIFSDCGSNFVGASRELKEFIKLTQSSDFNNQIAKSLSLQEIQWKFNPPSAPHMGGLWEAGIKSTKFHLRRVVGERSLNFEELSTLLCKIEACLNSRPLCASSSDIDSYDVLTPGHFLIHDSLVAVPEPCYSHLKENTLSRWQLIQHMSQQFWNRWSTEYLSRLQQRPKWASYQPNMEVGNLVLIKDERLPPQQWLLGRIIQVHAGTDGMVRVVTVKTKNGEMKRPITKLCSLPISNKD
ncbi:unnamed protein product [Allacma fusca]|uniref:Integrase catalytic domain-containing protein n=1 Tax=Allacma fusca TaxID=39272 RepID=A0A8J2KZ88_9HEXA|nr:unnamed protein product [Allacma fusca]